MENDAEVLHEDGKVTVASEGWDKCRGSGFWDGKAVPSGSPDCNNDTEGLGTGSVVASLPTPDRWYSSSITVTAFQYPANKKIIKTTNIGLKLLMCASNFTETETQGPGYTA